MTLRPAVAVARTAAAELCELLALSPLDAARPGAVGLLAPPVLLRAADGWVHPGPPTAWPEFAAMVGALAERGARPAVREGGGSTPTGEAVLHRTSGLPDVSWIPAEVIDREAGEWMLPAVAVRSEPAAPPEVRRPGGPARVDGARVVVLGSAWAAPLTGLVLHELGADVTRVTDPRRRDPFPLRDALGHGQRELALDLGSPEDRDGFARLLEHSDLLVDGTTPRVLRNIGLGDPGIATVRIAAFAASDRPGYGIAAEARGGWAARLDPPRLGRASVADPIAGLLAALLAVDAIADGSPALRERISLEQAVGHLLAAEARGA